MPSVVFKSPGLVPYSKALDLQMASVDRLQAEPDLSHVVYALEHSSVFTLGKNGGKENLCVSESFLKDQNIQVVPTGRGGNITYHGPGQLVLYPIVRLSDLKLSVDAFVEGLEQVMILTLDHFSIKGARSSRNRGIWVKEKKIGSIGLGIKRGITFHGMALNFNVDLTPFSWINPCGLDNILMTSVKQETDITALSIRDGFSCLKQNFKKVFGYQEFKTDAAG